MPNNVTQPATAYDEVPYASFPFAQSHPNRLATVATLFGMQPPAVESCRVLELGCASGGNLIPMAEQVPGAQFYGCDLSTRQIAAGQQMIAETGLTNVRVEARSILDITPELGTFDYIACHGVWSWVPAEVRQKILEICRDQLSPQGVAFISYNTLPGWHFRGTVRDMMFYHSRKFGTPAERVGHARALLDFLVRSVQGDKSAYAVLLKSEMELLRTKSDSYLLHEHLEAVNEPMYFYQFEEQLGAAQLQFLGEADISSMLAQSFSSEVDQIIRRLSANIVEMEQYLDFLKNRTFRQTLICHRGVRIERKPDERGLAQLRIAGLTEPSEQPANLSPGHEVKFTGAHGRINTSDPGAKALLVVLREAWPRSVPFGELVKQVRKTVADAGLADAVDTVNETSVGSNVIHCHLRGFVRILAAELPCAAVAGTHPRGAAVARWYAMKGPNVTNLAHEVVQLNDLGRQVLLLADGTRDRSALADEVSKLATKNAIILTSDAERLMPAEMLVAQTLTKLAMHSLLLA